MEKKHIAIAKDMIENINEFNISSKENEDRESYSHLKWMLETVIEDSMSDTKASRWLGYTQGVLAFKGVEEFELFLNINNLEEKTKDMSQAHLDVIQLYFDEKKGFHNVDSKTNEIFEKFNIEFLLNKIKNDEWEHDDSNRVLGMIQGIFCCSGYLNVELERSRTRQLFNGD